MLRRIILPLVKPGIVAGSILVFIPSLGAYVTPRMLGGGKKMMIGNLIELQFGQGRNWPLGAALSITLMVIVHVALLVYVRNASKSEAAMARQHFPSRAPAGLHVHRDVLLLPALSADCHAGGLLLQRRPVGDDLGRVFAALVHVGLDQRPGPGGHAALADHRHVAAADRHDRGDHGRAGDDADGALSAARPSAMSSSTSR